MAQQIINTGAVANDGTGDPLRTAFTETNSNFTEIYAAGPVDSNVRIANNTVLTINTNGNLVLAPNGVGVVQSNVSIVPNQANVRNLGSSTARWGTVYAKYVDITNGSIYSGDLTVTGNLSAATVTTPELTVNMIRSDDSTVVNIQDGVEVDGDVLVNGNVTADYVLGDGSQLMNISVGNSGAVQFNWQGSLSNQGGTPGDTYSTLQFDSNGMPTLDGTTAYQQRVDYSPYLQVLAPRVESTDFDIVAGPGITVVGYDDNYNTPRSAYLSVQDQANATQQWDFGILGNGSNAFSIQNRTASTVPLVISTDGTVTASTIITNDISSDDSSFVTIQDGLNVVGDIETGGNVTADYFIGDGSQLTGLPEQYGNANVATFLAAYGSNTVVTTGNVSAGYVLTSAEVIASGVIQTGTGFSTGGYLSVNGSTDLHDTNIIGNLSVNTIRSDDSTVVKIQDGVEIDGDAIVNGNVTADYFIGDGSQLTNLPGGGSTGNVTFDDMVVIGTGDPAGGLGLYLAPGPTSTANLQFLRVRGGDVVTHIHLDTGNNQYYDQYFGDDGKYVKLELGDAGNVVVGTDDAAGNSYNWTFTSDGNLILADGNSVIQSIANSSLDPVNPNVSTMVLTPDSGYSTQSLVLDPTAPGHIHLRAPGANIDEPSANIFLGGEDSSFEVGYYDGAAPNVFVHSGGNTWTFGTDGILTFPGNLVIAGNTSVFGIDAALITPAPDLPLIALSAGANGSVSSLWIEDPFNVGTSNIAAVYANPISGSKIVRIAVGQNGVGSGPNLWDFGTDGNLSIPGNINFSGDASAAPSLNDFFSVTSAANFAIVTDNANADHTWTFGANGNLTAPGNISVVGNITGAYILGNGSQLTGLPATYGNANVVANLAALGSNPISTTGNITSGNISTGIITLTNGAVIRDTAGDAVAFGQGAGLTNQGLYAVAIGETAGNTSQGLYGVAVGQEAGSNIQGYGAVAVGSSAGYDTQGTQAVAIGIYAGYITQGANSVAVGYNAGHASQGINAVAMGYYAGNSSQGANAVAIGTSAGLTNQGNNSIILNATGSALNQTTANTFTVKPVRQANTANAMYYDASTGEITYDTTSYNAGTPAWTSAGAITLTATTTTPTKGTTTSDNISYRQLGAKQWEIILTYIQTVANGVSGSGDYLVTLPNSLSFDTTLPSQQITTTNIGTNTYALMSYIIPSGSGLINNDSLGGQVYPIVYDATKFRILTTSWGSAIQCWGSGYYSLGGDDPKIQLTFRFTST